MKAQARIVLISAANGVCGALLALGVSFGWISVGVAVVTAIAVMAATWIFLRQAISSRQAERDRSQ